VKRDRIISDIEKNPKLSRGGTLQGPPNTMGSSITEERKEERNSTRASGNHSGADYENNRSQRASGERNQPGKLVLRKGDERGTKAFVGRGSFYLQEKVGDHSEHKINGLLGRERSWQKERNHHTQ